MRFRDAGLVRGLIVSALSTRLHEAGHQASTTVAGDALAALRPHSGYAEPGYRPPPYRRLPASTIPRAISSRLCLRAGAVRPRRSRAGYSAHG